MPPDEWIGQYVDHNTQRLKQKYFNRLWSQNEYDGKLFENELEAKHHIRYGRMIGFTRNFYNSFSAGKITKVNFKRK